MKKLTYLAILLSVGFIQACNNPQSKDSVSMANDANEGNDSMGHVDTSVVGLGEFRDSSSVFNDSDFAVKAADGGMLEVQLGKITSTNASNQGVKDFGKSMVEDHTKINNELATLAKEKNITLPPTPSNENVDHIKKLNEKMGSDFDKDYIDHMVSDHEQDIDLFEDASKNASDPDIKAFATKTLPTLRNHLAAAKQLKEKL